MVKTPTDVISQVVILSGDLSNNWDEFIGDSNEEELSEEREQSRIFWLLVVECVHNSIIVAEECDCPTCPTLPPELG